MANDATIKLSIDDEQSVRLIGTSDYGFDLLKTALYAARNRLQNAA
jgi:hypothetical protein